MRDVAELRPDELRAWQISGRAYVLLDVRSPQECRLAAMSGAVQIPMGEIPSRLADVSSDKPVVVVCHYGERSARVGAFLAANGFPEVYNLEGGIDAYAAQIDPTIGRY